MGNNDAADREKISANIMDTYNTYQAECETKNDLDKKIDDCKTKDVKKLITNDKNMENHYNLVKKRYLDDFQKNKELEDLKEQLRNQSTRSKPVYYESDESKYYREQKRIEELNSQKAAEELPNNLSIVKKDFTNGLDDKILKMKENIEKELVNYSPANLKILIKNLAENEKLIDKIIEYIKLASEKILEKSYKNTNHFNILLLGKTGVGKSTLINGTFNFSEKEEAKTGEGKPITKEFGEYTSDKRKGLRLIDSQGIELKNNDIDTVFKSTKKLIEDKAKEGDPDKFIHCIWYCFKSSGLRFEDCEKEILTLIMKQYYDDNLPIIIVITQNYIERDTEIMIDFLKKEFQFLKKEIIIIPVVAKKKALGNKKKELIVEEDGIEELIKVSFEKSQRAILPAILKSIEVKINQIFSKNIENKKNKLEKDLKEFYQKLFNKIKEKNKIKKNFSKLSTVISKTLDIFFEFVVDNENENIENQEIKEEEQKEVEDEEKLENVEKEENKKNIENIENKNEENIEQKNEIKENEENINNIVNNVEKNIENNLNNLENQENEEVEENKENMEGINDEEQKDNNEIDELIPEENNNENNANNQEQIGKEELNEDQNHMENQEQNEQIEQNDQIEEGEEGEESEENSEDEGNNEEFEHNEAIDKNLNEINLFLDDLCKWFIGRLNEIISSLIKENSNELGKLLLNEQTKVKKNHNVEKTLSNEQTIDQYIIQSEHDLKQIITKKVYLLALKNFYNILSENIVKVSEVIISEQFHKVLPELKNYISEEKLQKISEEILEEMLKNK